MSQEEKKKNADLLEIKIALMFLEERKKGQQELLDLATTQLEQTEEQIAKTQAKKMLLEEEIKVVFGEKQVD